MSRGKDEYRQGTDSSSLDNDFPIGSKSNRFSVRNTSDDDETEENFTNLDLCSTDNDDVFSSQDSFQPNPMTIEDQNGKLRLTSYYGEQAQNIFIGSSWKSHSSMFALVNQNPIRFFLTIIPKDYPELLRCRLVREPTSVMPMFHLEMEFESESEPGNKLIRLLTAKKQMRLFGGSQYNISLSRDSNTNLPFAELFCDRITGTSYVLKYINAIDRDEQQGLVLIQYASNFFGFSGPRRFHVFVPKSPMAIETLQDIPNIFDEGLSKQNENYFYQLENRAPVWNEELEVYTLKFEGHKRVAIPSLKNFQLLFKNENGEDIVVMQHGRMADHSLSCDFRYPLSILQAFAVALSSIESFLLRE